MGSLKVLAFVSVLQLVFGASEYIVTRLDCATSDKSLVQANCEHGKSDISMKIDVLKPQNLVVVSLIVMIITTK